MKKRSVRIAGHATSLSLEDEFWAELDGIARRRSLTIAAVVAEIDAARGGRGNLSSALRVYILKTVKETDDSRS